MQGWRTICCGRVVPFPTTASLLHLPLHWVSKCGAKWWEACWEASWKRWLLPWYLPHLHPHAVLCFALLCLIATLAARCITVPRVSFHCIALYHHCIVLPPISDIVRCIASYLRAPRHTKHTHGMHETASTPPHLSFVLCCFVFCL